MSKLILEEKRKRLDFLSTRKITPASRKNHPTSRKITPSVMKSPKHQRPAQANQALERACQGGADRTLP